jgi:mannose-1-phosphate guanylyltransferase
VRFVEKPAPGTEPSNLINAGTYVLEPSVLARIPLGERSSIERDTFPKVAAEGRFHSFATDDYWIDAGRPELYRRANLDLVNGTRVEVCEPIDAGADIAPDAVIGDSVVGAATIGAGARVTGSVVLPGARIGPGAVVEDSIVAGEIGRDVVLVRTVVGADAKISDGEHLRDARVPEPVD